MKRLVISLSLLLAPAPGLAQDKAEPAVLKALLACRAQPSEAERVRCYDATVDSLQSGIRDGSVVVVDRKRAQRSLFGLATPDFLRSSEGKDDMPDTIEGVVASSAAIGYQQWLVTLEGGGTWRTTDSSRGEPPPAPGSQVTVERGAVGGFYLKAKGKRMMRAQRIR